MSVFTAIAFNFVFAEMDIALVPYTVDFVVGSLPSKV